MNWNGSSEEDTSPSSRTPLISIGCTILAVLLVPVFLYSLGPGGPIKVGDVVFATDRHRVSMIDSNVEGERKQSMTCFLEPRVQLVSADNRDSARRLDNCRADRLRKVDATFLPTEDAGVGSPSSSDFTGKFMGWSARHAFAFLL